MEKILLHKYLWMFSTTLEPESWIVTSTPCEFQEPEKILQSSFDVTSKMARVSRLRD